MDLYDQIAAGAAELVEKAKLIISPDTAMTDRLAILLDTINDVVVLAERVIAPGEQKRLLAERVIGELYDVLAAYDIPYIPGFIETKIEVQFKPVFVETCLKLVDRLVDRFNRTNAWGALGVEKVS